MARQFSDLFDLGDWWSICTDNLAKVIVLVSIAMSDHLIDNEKLRLEKEQVRRNNFMRFADY